MSIVWKPLIIVVGLLLLLTYLFVQSRISDLDVQVRLQAALQAFELHDVELTRDVLRARAGLLPHYDALAQASGGLSQAVETLRQGSASASGQAPAVFSPHVETLATALKHKLTLLEYVKSDNALLRNSLMYLLYAGQTLRSQGAAAPLSADLGALSHALLRFLNTPKPVVGAEIEAILERFQSVRPLPKDLAILVAHAQLIVDVLPQVDAQVRELIAAPTTPKARTLRDAILHYYRQAESRAQFFNVFLYLVAMILLGYLVALFIRLRAQARDLRRANTQLRQEMTDRQQAEQALRTSEERFRAITETAREAIISADGTGTIISWNAAATALFGYETEAVLGTPLTRLIPARYRDAHTHAFAQWVATGRIQLMDSPVEFAGVHQDGTEFPLDLSLSTWATAQGLYVTGIIRDLTARKRLEEKTREQELQLIQANKMTALGTLVASVAHEINNPNQLMMMNAQVLADAWRDAIGPLDTYQRDSGEFLLGGLPYAEMRETLPALVQDVHDGARRIERIVADLRHFARPHPQGTQAPFHLNEAVERALRLLTHLISRKATHVDVNLDEALPRVQGDEQQVEQIIVNLVVNALEALPESGGRVTISTAFDPAAHRVIVTVRDDGMGIPPEHLARLCDPFFTTKQASGGTGLGLAITMTLVRAHGGCLVFDSKPGQGTCARVSLPCPHEAPTSQAGAGSRTPVGEAERRF